MRQSRLHLGWLALAIATDLAALLLWNLTFVSCTELIEGAGECTTSPVPRIAAVLLIMLSVGFVLKALTAGRGADGLEVAGADAPTTSAGGSALAERLLYRRDLWGLDYGADLPPCSPPVALAPDAAAQRERYGPMLTELWTLVVDADYADVAPPSRDEDPDAWTALVAGVDEEDGAAIRAWQRAHDAREQALSRDLPKQSIRQARETMLAVSPAPLRRITYLPLEGDHLSIVGTTVVTSLGLYAEADSFVDALERALASRPGS